MDFNYEGREKVAELVVYNRFNKKDGLIVFYEDKVLSITRDSAYIKAKEQEMGSKFKAEGVGFFKRRAKMDEYWNGFGERFNYMSEDEIDKEFNKVKKMSCSYIDKYKLTFFEKDGERDIEGDKQDKHGEMMIKSAGEKLSFLHSYTKDSQEYNLMVNILENKTVNATGDIEK